MSNYIEYKDRIAFHPGYYIKEIIDESGLSQKDFAYRLDTTPKNLSILVRGEQRLSIDIAMKLSRMLGTSVDYWLNLQKSYDTLIAEFESEKLLEREKRIFKYYQYEYFMKNFGLPNKSKKKSEQIKVVREFLKVSTLDVLTNSDLNIFGCKEMYSMTEADRARANTMVQIAINKALEITVPKYDKKKFKEAAEQALTINGAANNDYPYLQQSFAEAGVILIILPDLPNSGITGATKKIGPNIMLMINEKNVQTAKFTSILCQEIEHILNGDYGITFEEKGIKN